MKTFLQHAQSFSRKYGLPVPTALVGTTDAASLQLLEIMTGVGEEIRSYANWQAVAKTGSWTSVATLSQGALATLLEANYDKIIKDTFWDTTSKRRIEGPLSPTQWQLRVNWLGGVQYSYRIRAGLLEITPVMAAGSAMQLIYKSKNWILAADNVTYKMAITADTDYAVFDDELFRKGIEAQWLRLKGVRSGKEQDDFDSILMNKASSDVVKPMIDLSNSPIYRPYYTIIQ